jgi:hypothetical protein
VTAILDASLSADGTPAGRDLLTAALGALGQDQLVSKLLERLEEDVNKFFTLGGQLKKGADSPLVQANNKVTEKDVQVKAWEKKVDESKEIEGRVKALGEERVCLADECACLEQRVRLLRLVEAASAVVATEKELAEKESAYGEAERTLKQITEGLAVATNSCATAKGALEAKQQSAEGDREAQRAKFTAQRDGAIGRLQSAQKVQDAQERVQTRGRELNEAGEQSQQAQQTRARAEKIVALATVLGQLETLKQATAERGEQAARLKTAKVELERAERAREKAENTVISLKGALEKANKAATERENRRVHLNADLSAAQGEESKALQAVTDAKKAIDCSQRLDAAKKKLDDLLKAERELQSNLDGTATEKQDCKARIRKLRPLRLRDAVLAILFLCGPLAVAFGLAQDVGAFIFVLLIAWSILVPCAFLSLVFWRWKRRGVWLRKLDNLAAVMEDLRVKQNQLPLQRGRAEGEVEAKRSELNRARAALGEQDAQTALQKAQSQLQGIRKKREKLKQELSCLEAENPRPDAVTPAQIQNAETELEKQKRQEEEKRQAHSEAVIELTRLQTLLDAAASAAAPFDLADLDKRIRAARKEMGPEAASLAPDLKDAQTNLNDATQKATEKENAVTLCKDRLSDAKKEFDKLAAALGQPVEEVLTKVQETQREAEKALDALEKTAPAEVTAAERDLQKEQTEVTRLDTECKKAQALAADAAKARNKAQRKRDEEWGKLAQLQSVPTADRGRPEALLSNARTELKEQQQPDGGTAWPEDLAQAQTLLDQRRIAFQKTEKKLHEARGELAHFGGAVANERLADERESLEVLRKSAEGLEFHACATKHLRDVLKEEDAKCTAHLGRSLAKPVTEQFIELTSGTYQQVVLDPNLCVQTIAAQGSDRGLDAFSVGTRDQLATLIRLALAGHLKTVLLLDDQLTQSDPQRMVWFRDQLRASVKRYGHQIIVITCRPSDYLHAEEMPAPPGPTFEAGDGGLTVVDLEQVFQGGLDVASRNFSRAVVGLTR